MLKLLPLLLTFISISSCQKITQVLEGESYEETLDLSTKSEHFSVIFSHNINGETHPCGCRQFPLGGLPQVAGAIAQIERKTPTLLLDSGDTFFPNNSIPKTMENSLKFIANELVDSMNKLGYHFYTPGDQDFAAGIDFLNQLAMKAKFKFVMTNLKDSTKIKSAPWAKVKVGSKSIYILGVTDPETLRAEYRPYFSIPEQAIKKTLVDINKLKNKGDQIILLSHSGMDRDKAFAKQFTDIDWIIGAHTMNFLRYTVDVEKTKIVQVLSRNHYLGHIQFKYDDFNKFKYDVIEVRDELKDIIPNNPYNEFLVQHKSKLLEIQKKEQMDMLASVSDHSRAPTYSSCIECHQKQVDFWQGTAHSIAYATLHKNNEHFNTQCIGCHSLKFQQEGGFATPQAIAQSSDGKVVSNDDYLNKLAKIFTKVSVVRDMKANQVRKISGEWIELDKKNEVSHNFANVQCLNCHDKSYDHPFSVDESKTTDYGAKCIQCHTADQSPSWYHKDDKGLADKVNADVVKQKIKLIACPQGKPTL